MARDKGGKFAKRRTYRKRVVVPRVLVLERGRGSKVPFAAIEVHMAGGRVYAYTLAGAHKVVR